MCPPNNWPQYYAPTMQLIFGPKRIFTILMCPLPTTGLLNTMHLTTMQLIFGPRWIFNILMCPLANNWPPQYYAPHYYAAGSLVQRVDIHILMCPLGQQLASILCTSLTMQIGSLVQRVDIQIF
jgi:hypothetical protein